LATPARRLQLRQRFVDYTLGLWHFLAVDPRVPPALRAEMAGYSLCADEWPELQHLPPTPYIREGRRLLSDDVFTQEDYRRRSGAHLPPGTPGVAATSPLAFSVALGFWFIDCHPVRHTAVAGLLRNEGCLQHSGGNGGSSPFEVPFGILVPRAGAVDNLLAVCAVGASHVGFQPLRVEPTFMALGQAAGTAAALALQNGITPRVLGAARLQAALREQGAILTLGEQRPAPVRALCAPPQA